MRTRTVMLGILLVCATAALSCQVSSRNDTSSRAKPDSINPIVDPSLAAFIGKIRAVDNHSHANSVAPGDADQDALPLEVIFPFEVPVRLRPEVNPDWVSACKALYKFPHGDLSEAHLDDLRASVHQIMTSQGDRFPAWVLDQVGTEVLLANRISMGPGLDLPRFRWVSYVDALMFPLSTETEAAASPDRAKLFPLVDRLRGRYLADLHLSKPPPTLDAYLQTVVTPTLEAQRQRGCVAVKFEAALLRSLDFDDVPRTAASQVYERHIRGGEPSPSDYKALQDFLFRHIAREAGRLGMAVHIHSFHGPGNFFQTAGADPFLLEPVLNDPSLRKTNFVLIHGGGIFSAHAGAMLWKPNVYVDMSGLTLLYTPARLAEVLRDWLTQYPEKVLFGSDAAALGPDMGWELAAWIATKTGREALALALTDMLHAGEVTRPRAEEIATMVMRSNADHLYKLDLK